MGTEIGSRHGEVAQHDLNVEGRGDHVTDEEEDEAVFGGGNPEVENSIAKPCPEDDDTDEFEPAMPPCRTSFGTEAQTEMDHGLGIEVETSECEDGEVEVMLEFDHELSKGVVFHDPIVISAPYGAKEPVRNSKKW